jgi:hypothetical protein
MRVKQRVSSLLEGFWANRPTGLQSIYISIEITILAGAHCIPIRGAVASFNHSSGIKIVLFLFCTAHNSGNSRVQNSVTFFRCTKKHEKLEKPQKKS